MKSLFYRIYPYFITFVVMEAVLRLKIGVAEWNNLDHGLLSILKTMVVGIIPDMAAFLYILPLLLLIQFCIPRKIHNTKAEYIIQGMLYAAFLFTILLTVVSQWLFWEELTSRFNFIAVDYLVYMDEVIGNIKESYPVTTILLVLVVMAIIGGYLYSSQTRRHTNSYFLGRQKLALLTGAIILSGCSFFAVSENTSALFNNSYENEIAKNGIFSLFSAFRNNELSYDKFYLTEKEPVALAHLRQHLSADGATFTDEGVTRNIISKDKEIHPNIVLITVESLSAEYMGAFGNKENLTPYLDTLASESLFFKDLYATGTRTVYGLSSITLSIPPIPGNAIVRRPNNEHLFSLGSLLNSKGYDSRFIYGGYGYFDNMNAFFGGNGYRVIDRSNLADDEITFANIWGVCDEDVYRRTLKENDASYTKNKPFFDMIMTTSNHQPFTYPEGKIDIPSGKGRNGGVKYTDYAIKQFIEEAKHHPWFDNTIFVIVADHTAGSSGKLDLTPEKYHIPMMFYAPKLIKPQIVEVLASQIDLAPTLLGIMNASYDSRFYGRDLMKKGEERAFIANYQYLGLLKSQSLTILKPKKKATMYRKEGHEFKRSNKLNKNLLTEAIAYFQNASRWQELNQHIDY